MYRVTWTNTDRGSHMHNQLCVTDQTDARALFAIVVRACVQGNAIDALLIGPDGNCIDSWGT